MNRVQISKAHEYIECLTKLGFVEDNMKKEKFDILTRYRLIFLFEVYFSKWQDFPPLKSLKNIIFCLEELQILK